LNSSEKFNSTEISTDLFYLLPFPKYEGARVGPKKTMPNLKKKKFKSILKG
jgi:hypothetical protein